MKEQASRVVPSFFRSPDGVKAFVSGIDCFLFDLDGVLWNGQDAVPGVADSISLLRKMVLFFIVSCDQPLDEQGKKIGFVTNNASRSRVSVVERLRGFGYDATVEEVFSSAFICSKHFANIGFQKKIFVIGNKGF